MKKSLLLATAAFPILLTATPSVQAQDASEEDALRQDIIVVKGTRYQIQQEIEAKRSSDVIYDSLAADEISAVPDFNVVDALDRIAGISAEYDEDEGRFINVRGIDSNLNKVTLNGMTIPSTGAFGGSGRNVNLEFLPSTAVTDLEVYKTFLPDLPGDSIGGNVNIKTRSAFDVSDLYFVAKAEVSEYELDIPGSNDLPFRGEVTFSNTFGENDNFGVALTGLYSVRSRDQRKFFGVSPRTGVDGVERLPNRFNVSLYNNDQTRFGGTGKFEFKNENTYAALSTYYFKQDQSEIRWVNNLRSYGSNDVTPVTATTGSIVDVRLDVTTSDFPIELTGSGTQFQFERTFGENDVLEFTAGTAKQSFDHDTTDLNFRIPNDDRLGFSYDVSPDVPVRTPVNDPAFFADPTNFENNFLRFRDLNTDETVNDYKVDWSHNVGRQTEGFGWKVGAEYRELERSRDNDEYRSSSLINFSDVLSDVAFSDPYQPEPFIFLDPGAVRNAFANVDIPLDAGRSLSSDFEYSEEINALYGMLVYDADRWKVSGGLRYEDTTFESSVRDGEGFTEGSFSNLLPSIAAHYDLTESLRVRAGFSQTIGRANPGDLTSTFSLTDLLLVGDGSAREDGIELIVSRGNPDLQPREADNYDLSLEYYFNDGEGLLSGAVFQKNIDGDIFNLRTIGTFEGRPAEFRQNVNAVGSQVRGLELQAYLGNMPFLPEPFDRFGVSANFTFLDGEMEIPTQNDDLSLDLTTLDRRIRQPDYSYNLSAFYNTDTWEARVSFRETDDYLLSIGRAEGNYSRLDASFKYRLSDNWIIYTKARNITSNDRRQFDDALDYSFLFGETDIDPSYHFQLIYKY